MKTRGVANNLSAMLMALFFNSIIGGVFAFFIGVNPMIGVITWNAVGLVAPSVNIVHFLFTGKQLPRIAGLSLEGLNQEIWIDRLLLDLFPSNEYLADLEDMSQFVDKDKINYAGIGSAPTVTKNRTDYPIPLAPREDMPFQIELAEYSTDSTLVQDAEVVELAYNKLDSVLKQHKEQIALELGNEGMFAMAPEANANYTPIIETSGGANANSLKKFVKEDIASLALAFDRLHYPSKGRVLVMSPEMFWEFVSTDSTLNRQYEMNAQQGVVTGVLLNYYGFEIRMRTGVPHYEKIGSIWTRKAYGSEVEGTDKYAAIAYIKGQSGVKAIGETTMYGGDRPETGYQGYIINFRVRAVVSALRQRMLGAIVQIAS